MRSLNQGPSPPPGPGRQISGSGQRPQHGGSVRATLRLSATTSPPDVCLLKRDTRTKASGPGINRAPCIDLKGSAARGGGCGAAPPHRARSRPPPRADFSRSTSQTERKQKNQECHQVKQNRTEQNKGGEEKEGRRGGLHPFEAENLN